MTDKSARSQDALAAMEEPVQPAGRRRTLDDVRRVGAEIIAKKGYKETSIRDIAEALGITKSTIYHHVQSKEQLLFDIIANYQVHGRKIIETARRAGPDPRASLRSFIRELVRMTAEEPVMAILLARELRSLNGDYRATVMATRDEYESFVRGIILNGQATGVFRNDVDARLATISVFAVANSLFQWYRPGGQLGPTEISTNFESILLGGLSVAAGDHAEEAKPSALLEPAAPSLS